MSQENSRFASMLNVNGTTYAYYPVSAVAGSEQLPYSCLLYTSSLPSIMLASDGTELARFQVEYRDPVELDQISEYVREGTVATEDERFYEHGGFDLAGIARAVYVNLTGSGKEGASTITQQLVRNTILADEMNDISFKRKVREMYLSVKLRCV